MGMKGRLELVLGEAEVLIENRVPVLPIHPRSKKPLADKGETWRAVYREDQRKKWTKPPFHPDGSLGDPSKPETWSIYNQVINAHKTGGFNGIGIELGGVPGLVGIDLDSCRDPATGKITGWAMNILGALNSYSEISPSETGARVLDYGELPPTGRKRGDIECYSEGRYVTLIGHHIPGTPTTIEKRPAELLVFHRHVFGEPVPVPSSTPTPAPWLPFFRARSTYQARCQRYCGASPSNAG